MKATRRLIAANRRKAVLLQSQHRGLWGQDATVVSARSRRVGRKYGALLKKQGRGIFGLTHEEHVAAGKMSTGGEATAAIEGALSAAGKIGGLKGGVIMGTFCRDIGFMQHIQRIRWGHSHKNCAYCKKYKGVFPPAPKS